jgi:hypothetical protein
VESYVALNGRLSQKIYRHKINLAKENENFKHKTWILPFNDTIRGFSILILLLFSLGSIAQNKIAGYYGWRWKKINAVEVYNKTTNIKVFTDAASGALNLIKNQEASILFSSKKATHCRTKQHYNWQYHNCAD